MVCKKPAQANSLDEGMWRHNTADVYARIAQCGNLDVMREYKYSVTYPLLSGM